MKVGPRLWALRYSEGFRVDSPKGQRIGEICELRFSSTSDQPVALVVRQEGMLGSRVLDIPVEHVADVVAEEERIVLVSQWPRRASYLRRLLGWTGFFAPGLVLILFGDEAALAVSGLAGSAF